MNLSLADLAELPLAAALLDGDETVVRTPEWRGAGPGAVTYRVRGGRLVVATQPAAVPCVTLLDLLLDELTGIAGAVGGVHGRRVTMLAASLGLLGGRDGRRDGSPEEVVELAAAGISARTALCLTARCHGRPAAVDAPIVALVLVQLAANAEAHDRAAAVDLEADGETFTLSWRSPPRGRPGAASPVTTARARRDRTRWGMGFARLAADAAGAALYPPVRGEDGRTRAVLEVGVARLALPLGAVRDGRVVTATRTWDEESGLAPPAPVPANSRTERCVAAAAAAAGDIATVSGWSARRGRRVTWIAVPPDGVAERACDVLDGMVHERALWDGIPTLARVRVVALAALLAAQLGVPLPRVPGVAWNRAAPGIAAALDIAPDQVPSITGVGAVDPQVALYLSAELGAPLIAAEDGLSLRVPAHRRDHLLARVLAGTGELVALR